MCACTLSINEMLKRLSAAERWGLHGKEDEKQKVTNKIDEQVKFTRGQSRALTTV